ncbi:MAG: hypothetical protein JWO52_3723 [Gammaproteobacteria bacterium]|jgi:hypothetical protein|nr:hypothetical protein [Gammaproteobacteria bacterium]
MEFEETQFESDPVPTPHRHGTGVLFSVDGRWSHYKQLCRKRMRRKGGVMSLTGNAHTLVVLSAIPDGIEALPAHTDLNVTPARCRFDPGSGGHPVKSCLTRQMASTFEQDARFPGDPGR